MSNKMGDFEHLLVIVGRLLSHLLNHAHISEKVNYVALLIECWNVDRKGTHPQFGQGFDFATADIKTYVSEHKFSSSINWNEIPAQARLVAPKFSLFKFVKATYL